MQKTYLFILWFLVSWMFVFAFVLISDKIDHKNFQASTVINTDPNIYNCELNNSTLWGCAISWNIRSTEKVATNTSPALSSWWWGWWGWGWWGLDIDDWSKNSGLNKWIHSAPINNKSVEENIVNKQDYEVRKNALSSNIVFTDTKEHWSKPYVEDLYLKWAIDSKEKFYPDNYLTRAELVKIAIEIFWHWRPENTSNTFLFWDINRSDWYIPYLSKCIELWIINSPSRDSNWNLSKFRPWDYVNRAEIVKVLFIASWVKDFNNSSNNNLSFNDLNKNEWYYDYVSYAINKWILKWYEDWTIQPTASVTRWQMSAISSRIINNK